MQRLLHRNRAVVGPLVAAVAVLAALLLFEIVKVNQSAGARVNDAPWNINLLGLPTTASLFLSSVVALIAREQYARSMRPYVRYDSEWIKSPTHDLVSSEQYREVTFHNVGPGTAIVRSIEWIVAASATPARSKYPRVEDLQVALDRLGLREGTDFYVVNFSPGAPLPPGYTELLFESTAEVVGVFTTLEAVIEFESALGDIYRRTVSLLPRLGASRAVTDE